MRAFTLGMLLGGAIGALLGGNLGTAIALAMVAGAFRLLA